MTKDDTLVIKGVAILMMLFLHLFNNAENVELCRCYFYIDGIPLVSYLERSTGPVACFLILSGYGMWIVNEKGDQNRVNRVLKLMLHYWLIMLIAVGVGSFILPEKYPGTFGDIVGNITSFSTSYNDHWWFLFPYLCLSLSSPWLFKFIRKIRPKRVLATSFFIGILTSFMISHFGAQYIYRNHLLYNFILYFHLMFPFLLGAMSARYNLLNYNIFSNFKISNGGGILWFLLLIAVVAIRACIETSVFHSLYTFALIFIIVNMKRNVYVDMTLKKLGKHSMNMWLIHGFICSYFFHDWLYSFKYPLLIFIVLVSISYVCSMIVEWIYKQGQWVISENFGGHLCKRGKQKE